MSDEELFQRSLQGDEEAFMQIYLRHGRDLFGFAMRSLGRREVAEDLIHDSFLVLLKKPSGFDSSKGSLRLYLFGIARNLIRKRLRRLNALEAERVEWRSQDQGRDPHQMIVRAEREERVRLAIFRLPPPQREALVLFHYQGFSLNEISRITGDRVDAVKQRLFRARMTLRKCLVDDLPVASAGK